MHEECDEIEMKFKFISKTEKKYHDSRPWCDLCVYRFSYNFILNKIDYKVDVYLCGSGSSVYISFVNEKSCTYPPQARLDLSNDGIWMYIGGIALEDYDYDRDILEKKELAPIKYLRQDIQNELDLYLSN